MWATKKRTRDEDAAHPLTKKRRIRLADLYECKVTEDDELGQDSEEEDSQKVTYGDGDGDGDSENEPTQPREDSSQDQDEDHSDQDEEQTRYTPITMPAWRVGILSETYAPTDILKNVKSAVPHSIKALVHPELAPFFFESTFPPGTVLFDYKMHERAINKERDLSCLLDGVEKPCPRYLEALYKSECQLLGSEKGFEDLLESLLVPESEAKQYYVYSCDLCSTCFLNLENKSFYILCAATVSGRHPVKLYKTNILQNGRTKLSARSRLRHTRGHSSFETRFVSCGACYEKYFCACEGAFTNRFSKHTKLCHSILV